jgi:hypothetical protein
MLDKARTLLSELSAPAEGTDPKQLGVKWKALHGLLKKAPCDQMRLARAIATRDADTMRTILDEVAKAPPPAPRGQNRFASASGEPAPARAAPMAPVMIRAEKPTSQQLKTALAAFKKRLKLTKLDQESRIGRAPMTGGIKSNIIAILPPNLYPRNYWEELEKQGQIRNTGGGFYELIEKAKPLKGDPPPAAEAAPEAEAVSDAEGAPEADAEGEEVSEPVEGENAQT